MRRLFPTRIRLILLSCLFRLSTTGGWAESPAELSEAAAWLQTYLRIDTTNPPGGEHLGAEFLAQILHREGIPSQRLVTPEGRTSLFARLRAEEGRRTGRALLLLHHIDVVPAGPGWSHDPMGERSKAALSGGGER